jgi:hypothetical protein
VVLERVEQNRFGQWLHGHTLAYGVNQSGSFYNHLINAILYDMNSDF